MSRNPFKNSKAALAFAAVTLFGAVSMVGSSEDGGMLTAVVERFGAEPAGQVSADQVRSETPSDGDKPANPGAGWGGSTSPFGDFTGQPPVPEQASAATGPSGGNPMTAPMAPTAIVNPNPPNSGFFPSGSDEPAPAE